MKKILIIPHHPGLFKIKIRLIEIAKALSKEYTIYLVNWTAALEEYSLWTRIFSTLKDIFAKTRFYFYKEGTINIVEFPFLHRPLFLVPGFNYSRIKKIIEKEKIDVLINGSYYMFNIPKKRDFKYIFDIADLPVLNDNTGFDRFVSKQTAKEINKADAVTVVSRGLVDYVNEKYRKKASFIPNGADIEKLRSVKTEDIAEIRRRHNLTGKWVIGYIGYIGSWVNVELLTESFHEIKSQMPDAILIWIGLSPNIKDLRKRYGGKDIIFTGGIEEDIEPYFKMLDLGILPHRKSLYQDMAFHLKGIEYTSAGKFVVSTPLKETRLLNFPNFIFAEEDKGAWVEAIKKARYSKWDEKWNSLADDYDWSSVCQRFINIIGDPN